MRKQGDQSSINGNLSVPVVERTNKMSWLSSPSPCVWRKRLHLVGGAESGQVTSVVRFDPNSSFPIHDHPDGEEIFVLDGEFSDEQGDWGAGSYMLNPEGYRHQPFSLRGCVLFVKLRQYLGRNRDQIALKTGDVDWQPSQFPGISEKILYRDSAYPESMKLEYWQPNLASIERSYPEGAEFFVLEGGFSDQQQNYDKGDWIRFPAFTEHLVQSDSGCVLYVKLDAVSQLNPG